MNLSEKKIVGEEKFWTSDIKEFIKKCMKRFRNINDGMAEMIINDEAGEELASPEGDKGSVNK